MAGKGGNVVPMRRLERISLDPVRFLALRRELGDAGAAELVRRTFEELGATLARMEEARSTGGGSEEFCHAGRRVSRLAAQIGLTRLARVAEDIVRLEGSDTPSALASAAVWARLRHLADGVLGQPEPVQEERGR